MRQLLLLRHAKSCWKEKRLNDYDRPLAKRGRLNSRVMGRWLNEEGVDIDLVISSPAKRAKETTRHVCRQINHRLKDVQWEAKLYDARVQNALKILSKVDKSIGTVMLVGHHEALDDLILRFSDPADIPDEPKLLPTAAIARFEVAGDWAEIRQGRTRLVSITRPRQLDGVYL